LGSGWKLDRIYAVLYEERGRQVPNIISFVAQ
jgi:hypothetical protein